MAVVFVDMVHVPLTARPLDLLYFVFFLVSKGVLVSLSELSHSDSCCSRFIYPHLFS